MPDEADYRELGQKARIGQVRNVEGSELGQDGLWWTDEHEWVRAGAVEWEDVGTAAGDVGADLAAHLADAVDAHDASAISFTPNGSIAATDVQTAIQEVRDEAVGAPTTADYLVGTANGSLSAEIVVGTTPGGELGGTWASPTVDATHSGSSHASVQAAAEATAAAALSAHVAAADPHTGYVQESLFDANTVLKADSDNTPVALTMGASTMLARLAAGSIVAATPSEIRTLLALVIGTNVQAWDADLDAIAALAASNDDIVQRKAGAWTNRTMAQLIADLGALGTTFQPLDSDLTSIAALTTTAFGRSLLEAANAAALRALADSPSNAEAILDTIIDAKGDLIAGTAADTPARVPVGADGLFLKADSVASTGVSWAAPTASVAISTANIAFTDGDTLRRVTITDALVSATSEIICTIVRPDVTDENDRGYIYIANVVDRNAGTFDVLVAALGWGFDDPTRIPPNETVILNYMVS